MLLQVFRHILAMIVITLRIEYFYRKFSFFFNIYFQAGEYYGEFQGQVYTQQTVTAQGNKCALNCAFFLNSFDDNNTAEL